MKRQRKGRGGLGFEILFEDQDMIAVNKPAGLLSVPFKGSKSPNVLELLNRHLEHKRQHAEIVHRIDRYTSGVVLYAKNSRARELLVKQFMAHEPRREYVALVRGVLKPRSGELTHFMKLSKNGFRQMVVAKKVPGATRAQLAYRTLANDQEVSLIAIQLRTGLKNQIRVQFAAIQHPIVGDRHYEENEAQVQELDHQALHARYLSLIHPRTRQRVEFHADLPKDMLNILNARKLETSASPPFFTHKSAAQQNSQSPGAAIRKRTLATNDIRQR